MAYKSIQHFIRILEGNGELIRIKEYVDPVLEISEVTDRISKSPGGGKALLFENNGTGFPLLINAFGSQKRISLALGYNNLELLQEEMRNLFNVFRISSGNIWEKLRVFPKLARISSWLPKTSGKAGYCQEVIHHKPDLSILPILKCWPADGGRFITLPMVITHSPENEIRNVGMYRMQVIDENTTAMHWHPHKTGAKHFSEYKKVKRKMPVAIALGGDPVLTYSATVPLPDNVDEFAFAGIIRKKSVVLVNCITQNLQVPAEADIVIEGYIDPEEELFLEGPFGDHTGFYSLPGLFPKFHITCITHRKNAVYPATIVGVPPQEDAWIAKATERIFLEPLRFTLLPEIEDLHLPVEGVAHNLAIVRMNTLYPTHAQKVMNALWGAGQMMYNKVMIIVDDIVDICDYKTLSREILKNFDPQENIQYNKGPLDILDHASSLVGFGSKLGIDATRKNDKTNHHTIQIKEILPTDQEKICNTINGMKKINSTLFGFSIPVLIIGVDTQDFDVHSLLNSMLQYDMLQQVKIIVLVEYTLDITNISLVVWYVLNNIDPLRDTFVYHHKGCHYFIVDGTIKAFTTKKYNRDWPNIIVSDKKTIERIDAVWHTLSLGDFISSPSKSILTLNKNKGAFYHVKE